MTAGFNANTKTNIANNAVGETINKIGICRCSAVILLSMCAT